MRLAVLSDIHSNNIAFEACIKDIEKSNIDGICLLGDYISDCPNPQATINLIRELKSRYKTWMIKGNREQYFIKHEEDIDDGWSYLSYEGSLLYTYDELSKKDLDIFRDLPMKVTVNISGTEPILMVHGSQRHLKELLFKDKDNTKQRMLEMQENYILSGHTHVQTHYRYKNKVLINPGSVGLAIGERATAQYAILEWSKKEWKVELKAVPYEFEKIRDIFHNSSLMNKGGVWPYCILKSLDEGINYGPLCSKKARDYAVEDGVDIENKKIPKKYWLKAAKDLGVIIE